MLDLRPQLLERRAGIPAHVGRQIVLVRHAVLTPDRGLLLDVAEEVLEVAAGKTYGDYDLARAVPGSPDVVVVVTADGVGKPVRLAEEVYGPRFTVVGGEDAGSGAVLRRQRVVDPRQVAAMFSQVFLSPHTCSPC